MLKNPEMLDELDGSRPKNPLLSIVVPVFNEEEAVRHFIPAIRAALDGVSDVRFEFVFINDGSRDGTLSRLLSIQRTEPNVRVIDLSRNFGKEAALTAGLDHCTGDIVAPMDVDLQDPPELLPQMIEAWRRGFDVVLAKRMSRNNDSLLKRWSAEAFYKLHNTVSEPVIAENVGDYRLMGRAVVDVLKQLRESRRFMKGLFAWAGFPSTIIGYERPSRTVGKTKFNGWKLWNLALEGITSFSTAPLRFWTYLGASVAVLSFAYGLYLVWRTLLFGVEVPGYASVFVAVVFLGALQLIGIGVIGEYLGRTYLEAKQRPVYIARKIYAGNVVPQSEHAPETIDVIADSVVGGNSVAPEVRCVELADS
ncbi:glycosyl transferase [Steroidobacter agaridevorans]|uniref:Glycosyl transferase n=1 Tax=Steroidobacter agaridevorans TaxID=2695856 RepID=A0A829Y9B4_9GAMM|nr:glycosyltransferase family 2 protein [Steroidobacter agaridevorans]GFE79934.1 glycosyl transferase [Steroidobacter agaridevorans]GFE90097.1 glycosyl transferase [Steroidobacter agaridevorans]